MLNSRQKPCRTSQSRNKNNFKNKPMFGGDQYQPDDKAWQEKQEALFCKLDKIGEPLSTIPNKTILDLDTLNLLKNKATVVSAKERQTAANERANNKLRLLAESEARKTKLQKYDMYMIKGQKLAQLDGEAMKKTSYLMNRAHELKQNQEEEIKQFNSFTVGTKCHAIRSAQIVEKELIQTQLKDENNRIEDMIKQQLALAAKKYEKEVENEKLKRKLQATAIVHQIKENEITRQMEEDRITEETRIRMEAAIMAQRVEVRDYQEKLQKQADMRKEFLQINEELKSIKNNEKELARIEIQQIQEHYRQKNEKEIKFEEEMRKQKLIKEKEIAIIQKSLKVSQDLQAAKDEMNALRTQDQVERQWRQKEREDAIRRAKENEEIKKAREKQIADQKENQALEIQRQKFELDRIIKSNLDDNERRKEQEREDKMKIEEYQKNLIKQVNEKEMNKIRERKMFFQEGLKYKENEATRQKAIRETMEKKIEELKLYNLPPKYINAIEKQFKLTE